MNGPIRQFRCRSLVAYTCCCAVGLGCRPGEHAADTSGTTVTFAIRYTKSAERSTASYLTHYTKHVPEKLDPKEFY